nr:hypothetical protein [Tanacetum cinerariifolium]
MHKVFPLPVMEFPLPEEVPTASEEICHCQKKREATAVKIALLVIEFGDSYVVPASTTNAETTDKASDGTSKKKGRTVTVTADDMQKRKNDVKERTPLLLSLPDEHQLRFSKYKTAQELLAAILKTFGGNEATKKTKKNLLKQQYGNFKAEGTETLELTFNRLLAPEWLMHTIVWRNRSDLDTISLDDLYNHLKVYESKVQKKSEPNPKNMAFISSAKHNRGNEDVTTASVSTASTNVSIATINIGMASISQDTACAYIASQSSGSQIKFEDINQINEDDMEEMNVKYNMALLSMRADKFWKKTARKISIQGTDVAGFDKSKVECFNCHKMGHFAREYKDPRSQDRENHALVAEKEAPTEFALMANTSAESKVFDNSLCSKDCKKNTDSLNRLGYSAVSPPPAQIYSSSKKDMSWTGLSEFKDDTITDYSRPAPNVESSPNDAQNRNSSVTKTEASPSIISPKSFIKFVKANDSPTTSKKDKAETVKKSPVKKFSTVNRKFPTANRKFPTGGTKFHTADIGKKGKAVKPLACWFWKPSQNLSDKGPNNNSVSVMFKKYTYIDTQDILNGCSRHMTGNISYLSEFEPFDGGYVSFGQGGCKITGIGTIKTSKLEFKNVYFVKDLKYNLFSVSQICDNKNSVLFTDSECIVLGQNFKLSDDDNMLLRTPRQHNMYLRSANECMLWHRRLESRNKEMNDFCSQKGIKREFSNARTPQQNGVAERRNRTLIEAARTITHAIEFLKPFGCHVMILNTLDNLGKFEEKGDEGYFIGYSTSSKAFRMFNKRTKRVEENLHVEFLKNKAIEKGDGLNWLFDIDSLTKSMNYVPVDEGITSTNLSGTKDAANQEVKQNVSSLRYIALLNWVHDALLESSSSKPQDDCSTDVSESSGNSNPTATSTNPSANQLETLTVETLIPTVSSPVPTACFTDSPEPSSNARLISKRVANQVKTPSLDNILTLAYRFENILGVITNSDEPNGVEADVSNMEKTITASPTPTLRIHKDHPKIQIIGPVDTPIQTRNKSKEVGEQSFIATIHQKTDLALLQFCLFSCFLSQVEPKKIYDALQDPS